MDATPRTLLIVDDDAILRGALESVFAPLGYRVLTAADPDAAYAILASSPVDAVLLDVRLPTMSGLALYLAIVHRWPQLEGRIAFMTADANAPDVRPWLDMHHCTVFPKPFRFQQLAHWLDATLLARDRKAATS
jgi:DNA-binding NtrC family response regulator